MKTIREYAEEYLQGKKKQAQTIIRENIIEPYGDRYFDEAFYNDMMETLRANEKFTKSWNSYNGISISLDDPQKIRYADESTDGRVSIDCGFDFYEERHEFKPCVEGMSIFFQFIDDDGDIIHVHEHHIQLFYNQQWKAILKFSNEEWALKLLKDGPELLLEKNRELEKLYNQALEELKEKTVERTKNIYEKKRALYLEEKKKEEEERKRKEDEEKVKQAAYNTMQSRAKAVIDLLNNIFAEVNAIERDCKDVPDGAWDEQLPKWHKVVTAKAREIAALSITQERLKDQAEYFASLDEEWIERNEEEITGF